MQESRYVRQERLPQFGREGQRALGKSTVAVVGLGALGSVGADLLVKGAYARSRLRQMMLGGRTRHIITNTEIPVLLSH